MEPKKKERERKHTLSSAGPCGQHTQGTSVRPGPSGGARATLCLARMTTVGFRPLYDVSKGLARKGGSADWWERDQTSSPN